MLLWRSLGPVLRLRRLCQKKGGHAPDEESGKSSGPCVSLSDEATGKGYESAGHDHEDAHSSRDEQNTYASKHKRKAHAYKRRQPRASGRSR